MKRLLIVEDNEQMRRLLKAVVAPVAQTIYECGVGDEALSSYRACNPDWVLMDIELPGIDGISATRQIIAAFPAARIVIVSDYGTERLREAARLAGASGYVLKENLRDVIGVLNRDRQELPRSS